MALTPGKQTMQRSTLLVAALLACNPSWSAAPAGKAEPAVAAASKATPPLEAASRPANAETPVRALLVADQETTLAAGMSGRLTELEPRPGGAVRKGQLVASFECSEPRARHDMALAEVHSARLAHDGKIRLQGLQSASELEVELAAAAVTKAQAQLAVAKAQLGQCRVVAPFAGWVVKWHAKPFEGVNVGAPLIELVSNRAPRLRLNVPSLWLSWLKAGTRFAVDIEETGKRYEVQLTQINGRVDPVSQTIAVEAELLRNDPDLLPGMSGTAVFAKPK
ncbi:efflux RND transporter periplasmic adaptor subunit [Candidatus Accumulibacter sp. ACC007]|uniref:efflux RND transporter periplasmic adaptor subunit n=1 Tax=Candidatus Accumulibacter sp. ACC007 TaxID=2823333 RepID=UPI0025BF353C|nr:efflux RND transporter periplasmic adaptor subunit [Candidatus Accumulibacter sp. ACC007]